MITMSIFWTLVLWLFGANGDLRRVVSNTKLICRNAARRRQPEGGR
jgi:hypothetical protein